MLVNGLAGFPSSGSTAEARACRQVPSGREPPLNRLGPVPLHILFNASYSGSQLSWFPGMWNGNEVAIKGGQEVGFSQEHAVNPLSKWPLPLVVPWVRTWGFPQWGPKCSRDSARRCGPSVSLWLCKVSTYYVPFACGSTGVLTHQSLCLRYASEPVSSRTE